MGMIEFGTIVNATLTKNDWHPLFEYNGIPIFVDLIQTTWIRRKGEQLLDYGVGEKYPVRILGVNYAKEMIGENPGVYFGSLNGLQKENPFKELSRFPPSTVFHAEFDRGIFTLPNGAFFSMPDEYIRKLLHGGGEIQAVIDSLRIPHWDSGVDILLSPFSLLSQNGFVAERFVSTNADFDVVRPNGKAPDFEWMLEYESIVPARFVKCDTEGGFFEYKGHSIFIDIQNSSWLLDDNPMSRMNVGDLVQVQILGCDYRKEQYFGSLNEIEYENPFRELSRFTPNTVFRGKVVKHVKLDDPTKPQGFAVMLPNRSWGFLTSPSAYRKDIQIGQDIDVVIYAFYCISRGYGKVLFETPECSGRKNFKPGKFVTSDADFDDVRPPRYKPIFD